MQNIYIAAVGKLKEKYLRDAFAEYEKRLSAFCRFRVIEIDEERLPDKPSEAEIKNGIEMLHLQALAAWKIWNE